MDGEDEGSQRLDRENPWVSGWENGLCLSLSALSVINEGQIHPTEPTRHGICKAPNASNIAQRRRLFRGILFPVSPTWGVSKNCYNYTAVNPSHQKQQLQHVSIAYKFRSRVFDLVHPIHVL